MLVLVALGSVWLNLAQMICCQMVVGGLEDSYKYFHSQEMIIDRDGGEGLSA